ncbi:11283_t:CDS:2, partial [Dentiscutata heterogama]
EYIVTAHKEHNNKSRVHRSSITKAPDSETASASQCNLRFGDCKSLSKHCGMREHCKQDSKEKKRAEEMDSQVSRTSIGKKPDVIMTMIKYEVAGEDIFLNVLMKGASGYNSTSTLIMHVKSLVHLLLTLRNIEIVNKSLMIQTL